MEYNRLTNGALVVPATATEESEVHVIERQVCTLAALRRNRYFAFHAEAHL